MNWSKWIRQSHRWLSIVFTAIVIGIFMAIAIGKQPAPWVYYLPLPPLFLMLLSGLYMFVLPYFARHSGQRLEEKV
jgi:membrane protein CcdC involved in cytochrome C biogenesis